MSAASAVHYNSTSFELFVLTSSATKKNSIENFTMDTSVIDKLSPKTYFYNSDPDAGRQIGYIAEEVQFVNKKFATYDTPNGDPVAIDYNTIVVFLVEEVKKLKKEIINLKSLIKV